MDQAKEFKPRDFDVIYVDELTHVTDGMLDAFRALCAKRSWRYAKQAQQRAMIAEVLNTHIQANKSML